MTDSLQYYTILTNKGLEYEANCLSTDSEFHITHIGVGDGNGSEIIPSVNQTTLVHEIKRYTVFNEEIDAAGGLYYAAIQIPASDGGFTIRELGGYNANGDLVMVAKFPPTEKRVQTTGDYRRTFIRMDLSIVNERTFPSVIDSSLAFPSTEYVENKLSQLNDNIELSVDNKLLNTLKIVYPIGAIYIGITQECPLSSLFGTWELVQSGLFLQQTDDDNVAGTIIPAGNPTVTVPITGWGVAGKSPGKITKGRIVVGSGSSEVSETLESLKAAGSSQILSIEGANQPPAFAVNIWQRTA